MKYLPDHIDMAFNCRVARLALEDILHTKEGNELKEELELLRAELNLKAEWLSWSIPRTIYAIQKEINKL